MERVNALGPDLARSLRHKLQGHPRVGDIRGRGFSWGIEVVKDRNTKEPVEPSEGVAMGIHHLGMQDPHNILLYPGTGTVNGRLGDHVLIAPAYNIGKDELSDLDERVANVINEYFQTRNQDRERDIKSHTDGIHHGNHRNNATGDKEGPTMLP